MGVGTAWTCIAWWLSIGIRVASRASGLKRGFDATGMKTATTCDLRESIDTKDFHCPLLQEP